MTYTRAFAVFLCLCAGCGGCYESSSAGSDAGIGFDARPPDAGSEDLCPEAAEPRLDPSSLPSCGMTMVTDTYPIETVSEGCERYLGTIGFPYASGDDLGVLGSLRWIEGGLAMTSDARLMSLTGAERLEHLGELSIIAQPHLASLEPLGRLRTVEGKLHLSSDNVLLASLHGLERLEEVGTLSIGFAPEHGDDVSLEPLRCLRRVHGNAMFSGIRRDEVDALLARIEVGGTVTLDGEVIVEGSGSGP